MTYTERGDHLQPRMKLKSTARRFPANSRDWQRALARAPQRVADANCSYDPNDPVAVAQAYANAQLRYPGQRGPQKSPTKVAVTIVTVAT